MKGQTRWILVILDHYLLFSTRIYVIISPYLHNVMYLCMVIGRSVLLNREPRTRLDAGTYGTMGGTYYANLIKKNQITKEN